MSEFSKLTLQITKQLSKTEKKEGGIFITPRSIIEKLVGIIGPISGNVLEPSCGPCAIVQYLDEVVSGYAIDAVEQNDTIYEHISQLSFANNAVRLIHGDFLEYTPDRTYGCIIGNPPYFVLPAESIPDKYREYMVGRPNIFGVFILHCLSMLEENGILAFIIPRSFLNAAYYSKIREYLKRNGDILSIVDFESESGGFLETQQSTIGFVYRKTGPREPVECAYSMAFAAQWVFSEDADRLRALFRGSTTLAALGLSVKTGNIVWNQKKQLLTASAEGATLLLYNTNINKHNAIELVDFSAKKRSSTTTSDEPPKNQYIRMPGTTDSVLVVNRGNGNSAYKLSYALVDGSTPYLVENHLNVIYSNQPLTNEQKTQLYATVIRSFQDPRTDQFIRTFLGNNGLSKTELETIFPIFV